MIWRLLAGVALAGTIVVVARRARSLSAGGAGTAFAIGVACMAAGGDWGALLILWFIATTLISRLGADRKAERTAGIVEKGGERDAWQVVANGGAYAVAALATLVWSTPTWALFGAASLAAAAADTWSTEIGTLAGGTPRSIATGRAVAPGTSGGITGRGLLGGVAGALFVALTAWALGWPRSSVIPIVVGGVAGSLVDSLLGAAVQARRWCAVCRGATEQHVHRCGTATAHAGGIAWVENDQVNLLASVAGGLIALAIG